MTVGRGVSRGSWLFWPQPLGQADVGHIERRQSNFPPSNPVNRCNFPAGWGCAKLDCCRQGLVLVVSHTARLQAGDIPPRSGGSVPSGAAINEVVPVWHLTEEPGFTPPHPQGLCTYHDRAPVVDSGCTASVSNPHLHLVPKSVLFFLCICIFPHTPVLLRSNTAMQ